MTHGLRQEPLTRQDTRALHVPARKEILETYYFSREIMIFYFAKEKLRTSMYLGLHLYPSSETRDNLNFIIDVKFSGLTCKYNT